MQPLSEQALGLGEITLNCAVGSEDGPSLVLLHGVTRCWRDFSALIPSLAEHWCLFAPDHRGHGKSGRGGDGYRVADYAGDITQLLERHVPGPAVLFGHSLGAMVAAMVAARLPERVRALVLEDPPGSTLAAGFHDSRFHLQFTGLQRLLAVSPSLDELIRELPELPVQHPRDGAVVKFRELRDAAALRFSAECLSKLAPRVLVPLVEGRWLDGLDWFGALPDIRCPTLLLRADPKCGGMLSEAEATRIATLIPNCTRVDLPGVGHAIHATAPARTLELVTRFLHSLKLQTTESTS